MEIGGRRMKKYFQSFLLLILLFIINAKGEATEEFSSGQEIYSAYHTAYSEIRKIMYGTRVNKIKELLSVYIYIYIYIYKYMGNPEDNFPSVHVTGTNGKGSLVIKTATAFQLAGNLLFTQR